MLFEFVNNESASTNRIFCPAFFFWFIKWICWCKYGCLTLQIYIGKCFILGFYRSHSYTSHHPPHQWCAYIIKKIDYYFSTIVPSLQNQAGLDTQCHASIPVRLIRHCGYRPLHQKSTALHNPPRYFSPPHGLPQTTKPYTPAMSCKVFNAFLFPKLVKTFVRHLFIHKQTITKKYLVVYFSCNRLMSQHRFWNERVASSRLFLLPITLQRVLSGFVKAYWRGIK